MTSNPVAPTAESALPETEAPGLPVLRVGETLDIYAVNDARPEWIRALSVGPGVAIDLQDIRRIDTAGAQLLWAARASALRDGQILQFRNPPSVVRSLWSRLGLPETALAP